MGLFRRIMARAYHARASRRAIGATAELLTRMKAPSPFEIGDPQEQNRFCTWLKEFESARVLELGTRRTGTCVSTTRRDWSAASATYVCSDFMAGEDVDVAADAEHLTQTFAPGSFDAVIACSVFEHIQRPWLAAAEIGKVLKPGGRVFVQTHFAFPLHAYPHDYWRFSREALETLFGDEQGFSKRASFYAFPCTILSREVPAALNQWAFLNVCLVAEKEHTPSIP